MDSRSDRMIVNEMRSYEQQLRKQGKDWPEIVKLLKARKKELIDDWKNTFDRADEFLTQEANPINGKVAYMPCKDANLTIRSISDIDGARNWTVISYYTAGTGYEEEAKRLIRSLKKFSLSYYVEGIRNLGSWQTNTHYKAQFIKRMLESLKAPVVFIDADAVVKKYPLLFDFIQDDMAAFFKSNEYDLLSGTMFWSYTKAALKLIDDWIDENKKNISVWEQKTLSSLLGRMENKPRIFRLPIEYCFIYDSKRKAADPVIEHHQSSRKYWQSIQSGEKSRARIAILTPTRDRPENIRRLVTSAIGTAAHPERVKFYFLVHSKIESSVPKDLQSDMHKHICIIKRPVPDGDHVNLSSLWNAIHREMAENADLYGFYGDDAEFRTPGWDDKIEIVFDNHQGLPWMVRTNDGFQKSKAVLFFTNRHLHDIAGFYMPEEYSNVAMDEFWYDVARQAKCYTFLEDVDTYHHSCAIEGRAQKDDTHRRARTRVREDLALFASPKERGRRKNLALKLKEECKRDEGKTALCIPARHDSKICIVISYYDSEATDRAARTWASSITLFVITDKKDCPPDNISMKAFLERNAETEGLSKQRKPFLKDILKAAKEKVPDADYYIYSNSDIILPPGFKPENLLPRDGKAAAVHHRWEMERGNGEEFISELKPLKYWQVGKDVFVFRSDVVDEIIKSFGDVIVGACNWDDGMACWLWMEYGFNNIDLRYGEIIHQFHGYQWSGHDADAKHNADELRKASIHFLSQKIGKWEPIFEKAKSNGYYKAEPEKVGILQPGRLGDIVIVLPIAKKLYDQGYMPVWPVSENYLSLFSHYIPYVNAINSNSEGLGYKACIKTLDRMKIKNRLDLAIGFGGGAERWGEEPFDKYKYRVSKMDLTEKYNLEIIRNPKREKQLKEKLGLKDDYIVTHSKSSFLSYNFKIEDAVEVKPIDGFCLFDWIGIIVDAKELWCVDSCVANLVNQLNLCKGRRHFRPWYGRYDEREMMRKTPQLASEWDIIKK
jgi:hypothetical protein